MASSTTSYVTLDIKDQTSLAKAQNLVSTNSASNYIFSIDDQDGKVFLTTSSSQSVNIAGLSGTTDLDLDGSNLTISGSSNETFSGSLIDGGNVIYNGTGTLVLTRQAGAYVNSITINSGTLEIGSYSVNNNGIDDGVLLTESTIKNNSNLVFDSPQFVVPQISGTGSVTFIGSYYDLKNETYTGTTTVSGGELALAGTFTSSSIILKDSQSSVFLVDYGPNITYAKNISGLGSVKIEENVAFTGNLSYTGLTNIVDGTVIIQGNASLQNSSSVNLNSGTLDFSQAQQNNSLKGLTGAVNNFDTLNLGANTLTLHDTTVDIFGGDIVGSGGIVEAGSGTIKLNGTGNTWTGGITINSGAVELATGATASTGAIRFAGASKLIFDTDTATGSIQNFAIGDTIDIRSSGGSTLTGVRITADGVVLTGGSGFSTTLNIASPTSYSAGQFKLTSDGLGGTNVTLVTATNTGGGTTTGGSTSGTTSGTSPTSGSSTSTTPTVTGSNGYTAVLSPDDSTLLIYAPGQTDPTTVAAGQETALSGGTAIADPNGSVGDIARLYQAAFDRTPDLDGINYWIQQSDSGVSLTQMASFFSSSPEFLSLNNSEDNASFVNTLYENVLHRAADGDGASFWTQGLDSGVYTRGDVLNNFAQSQENIAGTSGMAGDPTTSEVTRIYQAAFDRAPDASGLSYWVQAMNSCTSPLQIAQTFTDSAEFQSDFTGLDDAGFVNQLYEHVFGQAGDAAGIQYWTNQMAAGETRAGVLLGFADSTQNQQQTAAQTHAGWVFIAS